MMVAKIHKDDQGRTIVAVCDRGLLGKKFVEGNVQLDLSSDFYAGEEMSADDIGDLLRNAYIVNLVGEESVKLGIAEEVVDKDNIIKVKGIPHAEGLLI